MKSIVCVNFELPTVEDELSYDSEGSLRDYDLVVFDPALPRFGRIEFSAGGSCISIDGTRRFNEATLHWSRELNGALAAGKTVFVVLSGYKEDQAAVSSTMTSKNSRNYTTAAINNYAVIPGKPRVRNSRGRRIAVRDPAFKGLYETIKEIVEYRVVFENQTSMRTIFTAKDGTAVGGVLKCQDWPGSLVLLPYVDFSADGFTDLSEEDGEVWSSKAINVSHAFVGQLLEIDRMLKDTRESTPAPSWVEEIDRPVTLSDIDQAVSEIDTRVAELLARRNKELARRDDVLEYSHLLYETGKPLERAVEKVLRLLGYAVETMRVGDLEIDHVITGPSGRRMIGETEGKDSTAVDISKFRQLESNIGEDFEREEVTQPAKGVLFGNGYRLSTPRSRAEQFTQKSLTNAKRLGSALIRTADLYPISLHLLDHPEDEDFKAECRAAIEDMEGGVVEFPTKGFRWPISAEATDA